MIERKAIRYYLFYVSAFVIITAGLKAASEIVVILLLSIILASILSPIMIFTKKIGIPKYVSFVFILFLIVVLFLGIFYIVNTSFKDFIMHLPSYEKKMKNLIILSVEYFDKRGFDLNPKEVLEGLDISALFKLGAGAVGNIGIFFSKTLLVLIGTSFLLFEAPIFGKKLSIIFKNNQSALENFTLFSKTVRRYFTIKLFTSFLTGFFILLVLLYFDIQYAILWGFLGFLLNFIPVIGSILASIPALLLSLLNHDFTTTLWLLLWYFVINNLISNVLEPKFMGQGLGLSPAVVFFSLIFWGWVLGAVGMFLAVVLTMTLKIAFDSNENTKWIGILLSDLSKTKVL